MPRNNREKSDKFKELAESRVNRAINMIRLIANLGNKAHYDYSSEQAKKIVNALEAEVRNVKVKFNSFGSVVKKVESYGSQSGQTSAKIIVADCGQLS